MEREGKEVMIFNVQRSMGAMVSCEGVTIEEVEQSLCAIIKILWSCLTRGVNTNGYRLFEELTITTDSGLRVSCSSVDCPEKLSRKPCIILSPKPLESIESMQRFGCRLFKSVLPIPNPGLVIHRVS